MTAKAHHQKIRVFVKVLAPEGVQQAEEAKSLGLEFVGRTAKADFFTTMLDKEQYAGDVGHFLAEMDSAVVDNQVLQNNIDIRATKLVWLAQNHRLLDLSAVEPDDMLVVGTQAQYEAASRFAGRK